MPAEQSNQCDEIQPWLAAYALGEAGDETAPREHLLACPECQRNLHEYRLVAGMLPYGAPEALPRPELREQVIAAIKQAAEAAPAVGAFASSPAAMPNPEPPEAAPALVRSSTPVMRPRRPRSFWAAFAFAAVAVVLLAWNLVLMRDLERREAQVALDRQDWQAMIVLLNDSSLQWYPVVGDVSYGRFWAVPNGQIGCLVAQGLPALREGEVYQVWLARDGKLTSGGTFEVRNGNGWILVRPGEPLAAHTSIFVTVEPEGGSAAPSGPHVISGALAVATTPGSADRQELLSLLSGLAPRRD